MAHVALSNCDNKMPFCERSYAHCSMYSYVHPRTFTCACVSNLMEGSARSNLRNILCITQICKWISTLDATLHYLRQFEQVQHVSCTLWIRSLEWEFMTEKRRVDVDDFASDCERGAMENQNQRSDGECRWRFGQSWVLVRSCSRTDDLS